MPDIMRHVAHQTQHQAQKQGYYLSLQHLQFMHLLHLSGYALDEYLQNQLEENPLLEQAEPEPEDIAEPDSEPETDHQESEFPVEMDDYFSEYDHFQDRNLVNTTKEAYQAPFAQYESFTELLKAQIDLMNVSHHEKLLATYIIDELEEDGYLKRTNEDIANNFTLAFSMITEPQEVEKAVKLVQQCDPPGIAARNLQECLLIQLRTIEKKNSTTYNAIYILEDFYKAFAGRDFKKIITSLNLSQAEFNAALDLIHSLSPKPNTCQDDYETLSNQITPAIEVTMEENDFNVSIINSRYANIRINPVAEDLNTIILSNKKKGKSEKKYWAKMLNEAHSLVVAIKQREKTMMNVMCSIIRLQKDFFRYGEMKMLRPMTLEQVAELACCDISTVSRITSNKYVQTSHGCFLLKTLFSGSLQSGSDQVSSHTVKEMIVEMISHENKSHPLTDNQIVDTLKEKGIAIARRTVVKYRDILGVPNHMLRHRLN
jgi:RNA polymerase sigma-54 factor